MMTKQQQYELLKVPFLQSMKEAERQMLFREAVVRTYAKEEYLFEEGEPISSIYLIMKGTVKLSRVDAQGREQIIGIFSATEVIWESVFMENARFPYSAVCLEPSAICRIERDDFEKVLQNPGTAFNIVIMLSRKLRDANRRNMILSEKDPMARVAEFIMYRITSGASGNELNLTLPTIAASVNLRPETVSRKIGELEKRGLIERFGKSGIRVKDYQALQKIYMAE